MWYQSAAEQGFKPAQDKIAHLEEQDALAETVRRGARAAGPRLEWGAL